MRISTASLVVLVGPSGSGKSAWARRWFRPSQVVSTDPLRSLLGEGERDRRAGADVFALLDDVLTRRFARRLLTVIDSTGLDADRRRGWVAAARAAGMPAVAVRFPTPPTVCRARNRQRPDAVPDTVVTDQLKRFAAIDSETLRADGFDAVHDAEDDVVVVAESLLEENGRPGPTGLRFGLHIAKFDWPGGHGEMRSTLGRVARTAEEVGFDLITVMDHFIQIPGVGRLWEDIPESTTTMGFLAASTNRVRLSVLVNGITYRNVAHLGKAAATLDVLSGGRAMCGLGAAWFEHEHRAYGWPFPPARERLDLLEDALRLLPVLWGPGNRPFEGSVLSVPDTSCYPRPVQEKLPILVGGSGERRTLRLVARYADACNLFGDAHAVATKLEVLHRHCADVGRDPTEIEVTSLGTALVGRDSSEVDALVAARMPAGASPERYKDEVSAGTVADQISRFGRLADAGVRTAVVGLSGVAEPGSLERFGEVISALR